MSAGRNWNLKAGETSELTKALGPGLGYREIARILGMKRSTVYYLEKNALRKIQKELRKFCRDQDV